MLRIFSIFYTKDEKDDVVDELIKELSLIGKLCFLFIVDTARCVINLLRLYLYWAILIAVLFVLYATREVVLEVLHETGIITLDTAGIIDKFANGVIDVIKDIAKGVTFGSVSVPIGDLDLVDKLGAMEDAKDLMSICDSIDTVSDELFHTLKLNTKKVCAVVRYMYPIDFVYSPLKSLLGWMIFDPKPVGQPGCEPPRLYMVCYIFNFYRMVQFLIEAIFWFTVITSYIRTINFFFEHFFFQIITVTLHVIHESLIILWHIITRTKPKHEHSLSDVLGV